MSFVFYTDGASSPKKDHGVGGWAFIATVEGAEGEIEHSGFEVDTTNNRMELRAIIESLRFMKMLGVPSSYVGATDVTIYSDSQYCVKGITEWIDGWKRTNWKNGTVKNIDLWKELDKLYSDPTLNVEVKWVRGHAGNEMNERVDRLCVEAKMQGIETVNT